MLLFARNILTAAVALCPAMAGADSGGTTLDMSDGLSESRVRCISQMPDGRMAVATTATIEVYDWTRFHTVKLLPEDACPLPAYHGDRQLTCDSLGYVWLRNDRTLYVIDTWQGKAVADVAAWPAGRPGGGAGGDTTARVRDCYGGTWTGTKESGIIYSHPGRGRQFKTTADSFAYARRPNFCSPRASQLSARYAPDATNCTIDDGGEYAYLGTRRGVMIIDREDRRVATIDESYGLSTNNIQSLVRDFNGDVWAVTANGISRIRTTGRDSFDIANYGELDGICVGGREFRTCQVHIGPGGIVTAGFVGGICTFCPDSVDVPRYTFAYPRPSRSADGGNRLPWGAWAATAAAALLAALAAARAARGRRRTKPGRPKADGTEICRQIADGIAGAQAADDGPTADEQFMARLAKTIEEHMADEEFSVLALSRLMAMDRTVLYRRMQAATGMSPSAYIKSIRMGVARRLLKDTQLSLADIARRTGFHSVKYFSAAFKDSFGMTPSEYRGS